MFSSWKSLISLFLFNRIISEWFWLYLLLRLQDTNLLFSLFFPLQLPRAVPWEKKLFLQPWEKSSYFKRTRHCFELQPRKLSLLSIFCRTCCTVFNFHSESVSSVVLVFHACSRRTGQKHDRFCKSCTTCGAAAQGDVSSRCGVTLQRLSLCVSLVDGGGHEPEPQVFISDQSMNEKATTHACFFLFCFCMKFLALCTLRHQTVFIHKCTLTFAVISSHFTVNSSWSDNLERAPRWRQQVHYARRFLCTQSLQAFPLRVDLTVCMFCSWIAGSDS